MKIEKIDIRYFQKDVLDAANMDRRDAMISRSEISLESLPDIGASLSRRPVCSRQLCIMQILQVDACAAAGSFWMC